MTAQTEQLSVLGSNPNANLNVVQFGIVGGNLQDYTRRITCALSAIGNLT